jgi:hypothetical protein
MNQIALPYTKRVRKSKRYLSQCAYCRVEKKYPEDFSSEHVMPESLGLFGKDTMTLNDLVCKKCNQYFGDTLELALGRDSVLGILYRSLAGIVDSPKFKKIIRHKRTRIEPSINCFERGYLLVDLELMPPNNFKVTVANQIIVMNSTKGNKLHFRADRLPQKETLLSLGLKPVEGWINFFSQGEDIPLRVAQFNSALKKAGLAIKLNERQFQKFNLEKRDQPVIFQSIIDEPVQRALAKIVFNYFLHQYPKSTVLSDSFKEIVHFIRYNLKATQFLMFMDYKPLSTNISLVQSSEFAWHRITIFQHPSNHYILGQLVLFNKIQCEVVLSRSYPITMFPTQSSIFDIEKQRICHK